MSATPNAKRFMKANDESPVVEGRVISHTEGGGFYRLANRKTFTLSRDDCRSLPEGYPRWTDL